jgi:AraC-like DNA-binding protein/quercetin dioxygenase-like cupin family protein
VAGNFAIMDHHLDLPGAVAVARSGKLVLSRLPPGHTVVPASAPSVKLILEGEGRYDFDGRSVVVRAGQFLYLDAGTSCMVGNRSTTIGLCIGVPHEATYAAPCGDGHDPVLGRSLVLSTQSSAMGRTLEDYGRRIARNPALGEALAGELVATVRYAIAEPLDESRAAIDGLKAAKPSTRRELYRRLERARGFLHDHHDRNVTLGEMASVAGLSQFHLARYFKSAFGQAPISYHRDLRLARAAELLQGGHSVASAAEATGYSDQVALSHAFRRRYGAPPQSWTQRKLAS